MSITQRQPEIAHPSNSQNKNSNGCCVSLSVSLSSQSSRISPLCCETKAKGTKFLVCLVTWWITNNHDYSNNQRHYLNEFFHPSLYHSILSCGVLVMWFLEDKVGCLVLVVLTSASVRHLLEPGVHCWFFSPFACCICSRQDICNVTQRGCKLLTSSQLDACVCSIILFAYFVC